MIRKIIILSLIFFLFCPLFSTSAAGGIVVNDPKYSEQWYLPQINVAGGWEKTTGSGEVVIAVIDTGVDIDHPDLVNNIWKNQDEIPDDGIDNDDNGYIDDIYGWNWVENNNDPNPTMINGFDPHSIHHGTMIAGLLAAQGNNGEGIIGISWRSKVMALRGLNSYGNGSTDIVAQAIDYAVDNGADIINLSMITSTKNTSLVGAIERAYEKGVIVVAAAGNEPDQKKGEDLDDHPVYPGCYEKEVLTVAATDTLDQRASFSNYGHSCVDLSAPGVGFYTTLFQKPTLILGASQNEMMFEDYYGGYYDGTSFSTPLVAGAAALIKSVRPGLTNDQVYEILIDNTDTINDLNPNYIDKLGSGRLNVGKAVEAAMVYSQGTGSEGYFSANSRLLLSVMGQGSARIYSFNQQGQIINQFLITMESTVDGFFMTTGDIDNDSVKEIIVGSGPGMKPSISIFDHQGNLKAIFSAFPTAFTGGVTVATGDLDNDGQIEIVAGLAGQEGPLVKIIDVQGNPQYMFPAYEEDFRGGVNVAVGDIDGDGYDDIVTAPRSGHSQIKVFDPKGNLKAQFSAYAPGFNGGVNLVVDNVDSDALAEIITAPVSNGGPHVKVFEYTGLMKSQFFAYSGFFSGGVSLAVMDINLDNQPEIVTAAGPTGGPHVRAFNKAGELKLEFFAFDHQMTKGLRIAGN